MFEFVGKLIGISLRTRNPLPFSFPSLMWKALVGEAVNKADLGDIDAICISNLKELSKCSEGGGAGISEEVMERR